MSGRMSSVSVRRVCSCFCFTGISLCGVYVTLFLVGYSNLAFFVCLSVAGLAGREISEIEGVCSLVPSSRGFWR